MNGGNTAGPYEIKRIRKGTVDTSKTRKISYLSNLPHFVATTACACG